MRSLFAMLSALLIATLVASVDAQDKKALSENDYYKLTSFPMTESVNLEAGGLELLPDGKLAISTRRGDIYLLENPMTDEPENAEFSLFASGLHEVLGLAWKDGCLYATQRGELTRIKDEDNDGRADLFETVSDGWEIDGDYHEYAFGSKPDKEGNIWVVLCLTGSFNSNSKYRGWCLRITPEGKVIPTCSGIRSPGGIGENAEGDMFYTDNQGPWNGTSSLKWLRPGSFQGHPGGNRWYEVTGGVIGPRPPDPTTNSRMMVEAKKIPQLEPPAVYFPYGKMGQSASGIVCDTTNGKFGPFKNQMFVGDQTHSTVMRVYLEKIKGHYQGACFPFRSGIGSGTLSLLLSPDGKMFIGGTNRGWGSRGTQPYSLDRLEWTGKTPFEVLEMRAKKDGFELTFTEKVDPQTAADPKSYQVTSQTVIYRADYGSPEVDGQQYTVTKVGVAPDGLSARLHLDKPVTEGHYHEVKMSGLRNSAGLSLLHDVGYYTMNYIPD